MAPVLGVLLMACAGIIATACAINFFWQTGYRKAFFWAAFVVGIFLLFWVSGLWIGASRHSWGVLAPLFALMMGIAWLAVKFLPKIVEKALMKLNDKK